VAQWVGFDWLRAAGVGAGEHRESGTIKDQYVSGGERDDQHATQGGHEVQLGCGGAPIRRIDCDVVG